MLEMKSRLNTSSDRELAKLTVDERRGPQRGGSSPGRPAAGKAENKTGAASEDGRENVCLHRCRRYLVVSAECFPLEGDAELSCTDSR